MSAVTAPVVPAVRVTPNHALSRVPMGTVIVAAPPARPPFATLTLSGTANGAAAGTTARISTASGFFSSVTVSGSGSTALRSRLSVFSAVRPENALSGSELNARCHPV